MKALPALALLLAGSPVFSQQPAAISLESMNVLYAGVENPLTLAVSDVPDSDLQLIPSLGTVQRDGAGHYSWFFCQYDSPQVTLLVRDASRRDTIGIFSFRVKKVPEPRVFLGADPGSCVWQTMSFKKAGGLSLVFENLDFEIRAEIDSYQIWYLPAGKEARVWQNPGARFTRETQHWVETARPGDAFVFRNVVYRGCQGIRRYLPDEIVFELR